MATWMLAATLVLASGAAAQQTDVSAQDAGGFRNVLPGGQGETVDGTEFGEFTATGEPPDSFIDQLPLYEGLLYEAPQLERGDLFEFFKTERFGLPERQVASETSPRNGVVIKRDRRFQVPHIFGRTRSDAMFGAGYATAQDRLFLMDVLRHSGRAELTELIGPGEDDSTAKMDAEQLKVADYSEAELQGMIQSMVASAGAEGRQVREDLRNYVDGINRYIREARVDPRKMPAEYAALGFPEGAEEWKPTDTVAVASLIGGNFGGGGGVEALASQALAAARERFAPDEEARAVFEDFRREEDPETPVTTTDRFEFFDPGSVDEDGDGVEDGAAVLDLDSIEERRVIVEESRGPDPTAAGPSWLQELQREGLSLPDKISNALLVSGSRSASGRPIAVMGPQVGFFSPEILLELDIHAPATAGSPGIDVRGAAFPGISLYVLIGRGRDFAWSATSAYGDNVDEFVEVLCEPDANGEPDPSAEVTRESDHYVYKGKCVPFETRRKVLQTRVQATDPGNAFKRYELLVKRSVHGPIQGTATIDEEPVAIAEARSAYFHEFASAIALKQLNSNEVSGPRSFQRAMNYVNFSFNWFYAGEEDVTYFQSGWYPLRAGGTDSSLPTLGTGEWDWQGFDPDTFLSDRMSFGDLPKDTNPGRGYFVNWNNKQAPGWRAADDQWVFGPTHLSELLEDRVRRRLRRGDRKVSVTELTQAMELAATVDLRGQELYPLLREVIGETGDPEAAKLLDLLDVWGKDGYHRRDLSRNNVLEHSGAVVLMDEWWPLLLDGMFKPVLGQDLIDRITPINPFGTPPPPNGNSWGYGWYSYVDKDLRTLLGRDVRNRFSRSYCGRGDRAACARLLVDTLKQAAANAEQRYNVSSVESIRRPATCEPDSSFPRTCDQIQFITAGAVGIDPIPLQNRPTFQQVVEVGSDLGGGPGGGADDGPGDDEDGPGDGGPGDGGPGGPGGDGGPPPTGGASDEPGDPGAAAGASDDERLPFTGLALGALALAGVGLAVGGALLGRRARRRGA